MPQAGKLKQRKVFSLSSEGLKSKIQVLTGLVSDESGSLCPHVTFPRQGREISSIPSSPNKDTHPIGSRPMLMTSLIMTNNLLEGPISTPHEEHLGSCGAFNM
jgi:hypothetical protein